MYVEKVWVLQTTDLEIGTSLSFDLTDMDGKVLHKSGMPITDRLVERLKRMNISSLTVKGAVPKQEIYSTELFLSAFSDDVIESIQQSLHQAEVSLAQVFDSLRSNDSVHLHELQASVEDFSQHANDDIGATLAVLADRLTRLEAPILSKEKSTQLLARSCALSVLGVAMCVILQPKDTDPTEVGLAGALHDCSLMLHPEWFATNNDATVSQQLCLDFRNHPLESAGRLRESGCNNEAVLTAVSQVHEQFDGSGFPFGLEAFDCMTSARILNLADAFLNLTHPIFGKSPLLSSDAVAYLCFHANQRKFDPSIFFSLLGGLSMYPVGSVVELDDRSMAMVIRSNMKGPLEPTVKSLDGLRKVIDLSISQRHIIGSAVNQITDAKRIKKSMMEQVLWRDDLPVDGSS